MNIFNHYWKVAGSTTHVWSSAEVDYVLISDTAYTDWLAFGNLPTPIATEAEMWVAIIGAGAASILADVAGAQSALVAHRTQSSEVSVGRAHTFVAPFSDSADDPTVEIDHLLDSVITNALRLHNSGIGTNAGVSLTFLSTSVEDARVAAQNSNLFLYTGAGTLRATLNSDGLKVEQRLGIGASPDATALLYGQKDALGATSTDGVIIANTTPATVGAQHQYSPRIRLRGQGWKSTATAASQSADWIVENRVTGSTDAPSTQLAFAYQRNNGGYSDVFTIIRYGHAAVTDFVFTGQATFGAAGGFSAYDNAGEAVFQTNGGRAFHLYIGGTALYVDASRNCGIDKVPAAKLDVNGFVNWNGQKRVATQFDKTSDTTLANVTGLSVTVEAGKTYYFEAILYTTCHATGGLKMAIAGTCTATAVIYQGICFGNGGTTASTRATALGTGISATGGTAERMHITGTITVNAGGTLTVQFAQAASHATASSVLVGSIFTVQQIA